MKNFVIVLQPGNYTPNCKTVILFYPPDTQKTRIRDEWANMGLLYYDDNFQDNLIKLFKRAICEKPLRISEIQNPCRIAGVKLTPWQKTVLTVLPEFIQKINNRLFTITQLIDTYGEQMLKMVGSTVKDLKKISIINRILNELCNQYPNIIEKTTIKQGKSILYRYLQ